MSDINQVDNNSEHCDSPSISALEFNPSAINVSEEIENLLADESISESENENKYANNKKDISELFQNSYMHMDEEFQKYLENFNESVKHNEYGAYSMSLGDRYYIKRKFFVCVMIIMFLVIIFPYFLVIMFRTKITDATVITLGISSTAEVVSSIIVLPKIIAKHLFNKKEEDNKREIISNMQTYNHEKQKRM